MNTTNENKGALRINKHIRFKLQHRNSGYKTSQTRQLLYHHHNFAILVASKDYRQTRDSLGRFTKGRRSIIYTPAPTKAHSSLTSTTYTRPESSLSNFEFFDSTQASTPFELTPSTFPNKPSTTALPNPDPEPIP